MADNDITAKPMNDGDIAPPPATTAFEPAAPLKDQGVEFAADNGSGTTEQAKQAIKDGAGRIGQQANDKVRQFAEQGKARAGGALDQLSQMLHDAADQVDDKLGGQYGGYARNAAGTVTNLSDSIKNKDVDELFDDARTFVRNSPGVAVGAAAALGFVVARLIQSGIDSDRAA